MDIGLGTSASAPLPWYRPVLWRSPAMHDVFIGSVSMFFVMILLPVSGQRRTRSSAPMGNLAAGAVARGMGLVYGVGNLGKFIGGGWRGSPVRAITSTATMAADPRLPVLRTVIDQRFRLSVYGPGLARSRSMRSIANEQPSTRSTEVVSAVCGIAGAVLSVAVMPFALCFISVSLP